MPRLFTGLEIPPPVVAELAAMRGGLPGARWIAPEDFHLTLRFIGDVDVALAERIDERLSGLGRGPVGVEFDSLSWFGADRPRAIVARMRPLAALVALQAAQERALRRLGLAADTRNFTPHVTLARLRGVSPAAVADYLAARGDLSASAFAATRFVLFSARPGVGGGPYVVEAEYPL